MTSEEIEIMIANIIHEINRLNASTQNMRQILVEVLQKPELSQADRARLKELLVSHQPDAQSLWLSEAAQKVRGKFEKAQTAKMDPFYRAGSKFQK